MRMLNKLQEGNICVLWDTSRSFMRGTYDGAEWDTLTSVSMGVTNL
jgi:hypothetical protein